MSRMTQAQRALHELVADYIDEAIDLIEVRGHHKRALQAKDKSLCLVGAYNVALYGTARPTATQINNPRLLPLNAAVQLALLDAIARTGSKAQTVYGWNDYRTRRVQEVLDVGRDAAKHERMIAQGLI